LLLDGDGPECGQSLFKMMPVRDVGPAVNSISNRQLMPGQLTSCRVLRAAHGEKLSDGGVVPSSTVPHRHLPMHGMFSLNMVYFVV